MTNLFATVRDALLASDPEEKCTLTRAAKAAWDAAQPGERIAANTVRARAPVQDPGRPTTPTLVHPRELTRRGLGSLDGRRAFVHAIVHIEFNAINLALDAVDRFADLPAEFYADWLQVATEEAYHFQLLHGRLRELGCEYGAFHGHNGLWDMAQRTRADPLVRMALVPRVLEARGLDVTPGMKRRLEQVGDTQSAALLQIILRDEIRHVDVGSRWFKWFCAQRGLNPTTTFEALVSEHFGSELRGPFNQQARIEAGFSHEELAALERLAQH